MQLMSWPLARLGSRFGFFFEPYHRRVLHSALGRFLDRPMDLMVGLIEPDGTERVMPFTQRGTLLYNLEQFERFNSITFRGFSEKYRLRFELNVHSVFYPENEQLCLMPAIYFEMRVSAAPSVRAIEPAGPTPSRVRLFFRVDRPETAITATTQDGARIDLTYRNSLQPRHDATVPPKASENSVEVRERIVSLSSSGECAVDADGKGLSLELPVSEVGSGIKWRLVWGAFCGDNVIEVTEGSSTRSAKFKYHEYWNNLDEMMRDAIDTRDERLALSRRVEKIIEQAPLRNAERHLVNQSFQSFIANTFWCTFASAEKKSGTALRRGEVAATDWFSVWEGSKFRHSTLDVEYNATPFYLSFWPRLLERQFSQWARFAKPHAASGGVYLPHDIGRDLRITGQTYHHDMPVEETANFLLMMQAYVHVTGNRDTITKHADLLHNLASYLLWTDRTGSGFPTEGVANTLVDAGPAAHEGTSQTYLAIKRLAALNASAELLSQVGRDEIAGRCEDAARDGATKVDSASWLGEHYAVCATPRADRSGLDSWDADADTELIQPAEFQGSDAYSIHTANGLLLPMITAQPLLFDSQRLLTDLTSALRETITPYGCSHTSADPDTIWISQNLWRDHVARYLGIHNLAWSPNYWDLQVMSNTHEQSMGYCETYISRNLNFYPRGVTSLGFLWSYPRLVIDRLAAGGARISVEPDRHYSQRWPLLPLADWAAGKIPVCVVDAAGRVTIEGEVDPIIVRGNAAASDVIG